MGKVTNRKPKGAKSERPRDAKASGVVPLKAERRLGKKAHLKKRTHSLLPTLAASATKPTTLADKRRRKKAANATALGAVHSMRDSIEQLIQERESETSRLAARAAGGAPASGRRRAKMVVEETSNLTAVLAHPAFQADPFGAIEAHLASTQVAAERERKRRDKDHSYA